MPTPFSLYEPREDSYLLAAQVAKYARGKVLDMGIGSGIQASTAAKQRKVKTVLAVDLQSGVIAHCRKTLDSKKIRFRVSDLFARIPEKFDTVIFNPPYLPNDPLVKDVALDGGKNGYELLERFLQQASEHLAKEGQILVVFSTLSKPERIRKILAELLLEYQQVATQRVFFEELLVYRITKSPLRSMLEQKKLRDIKKFTHGHRGMIFIALQGKQRVAVKAQLPNSPAKGTVEREARMLKVLNRKGIGPKLLFSGSDYFCYRFIEGTFVEEWVAKAKRPAIIRMLQNVLKQMRTLDLLKLNKEEMHHPHKHIIVDRKGKPSLVDFERARIVSRPKNVTQFCQYLRSTQFGGLLAKKGIRIDAERLTAAAREYSHAPSTARFQAIETIVLMKLRTAL